MDAALDAMIRKACAVRPEDRYQSAKAFYEDLAAWRTPRKTVLPMDDEQSRTTQVSFISHAQDADTSRGSSYSYRKAEEPVPKYPPKSDGRNVGNGQKYPLEGDGRNVGNGQKYPLEGDGRNVGNGQKKGGPGKGAVIALIMVVLLAFGGYIIMRVLHATQSSSPSNSMASSDSAYKEEVAKEEAAKEEAYKEEAAKEETYKEEKESNSAENEMAKEDTTPVGKSAEIVEIPDPGPGCRINQPPLR